MSIAFAPDTRAQSTDRHVRVLLSRTSRFVVPTTTLVAFLATRLQHEQFDHYPTDIVRWVMAMFDVTPVSGGRAVRRTDDIAELVNDELETLVGENDITLETAVRAVQAVLAPVYGHRVSITGWLPGQRVSGGKHVLVLSGRACPSCTTNPTGHRVGDKNRRERCINSDDCGWTAN